MPDFGGGDVLPLAVGVALLLFGRKLFWLAVAGIGFLIGLEVARRIPALDTELAELVVALLFGLGGLVFAVLAQKLAVGLGGLLIGGYATYWILQSLALGLPQIAVVGLVAVGAILGVVIAAALFEIALVVLSALAGAVLVVDAVGIAPPLDVGLLVLLVAIGFWFQGRGPRRRRRAA